MLEVLKVDGEIKGVCEWWIVNRDGTFNPNGEYIFINDVETSKSSENNGNLKYFIETITDKYPQAKYGYFRRRKYNDRIRMYSRRQFRKLIKEV